MSEERVVVCGEIPQESKDKLRKIAKENRRSLMSQIGWVLERYVDAQEDDGA